MYVTNTYKYTDIMRQRGASENIFCVTATLKHNIVYVTD